VAGVVSVVTLQRMDEWFRQARPETTYAKGLGPRRTVQAVPRDLGRLVSALDALGLKHVYADYWLAYRLDFDTRERIVASESSFAALPSSREDVRYRPYERAVKRARHGFVFYRPSVASVPIVPQLEQRGYRRHVVGSYVVYAPAA
jgi:hypothetical protein